MEVQTDALLTDVRMDLSFLKIISEEDVMLLTIRRPNLFIVFVYLIELSIPIVIIFASLF
jgi:hypothetical protein